MTRWKILVIALMLMGAAAAWAQASGRNRVALVVQVKGIVTHPEPIHGKRVQLKPFEAVNEGEKIEVRSGSEITLAFLKNNKRYTIKNPGTQAVWAEVTPQGFKEKVGVDSSSPARLAAKLPVEALDFSKMGGFSSRSLLKMVTRNDKLVVDLRRLKVELDLSSTAPTPVYWKEIGTHVDWQQTTGKVLHQSDGRTIVVVDLVPQGGKSYQVNIGEKPTPDKPGYHLDLYRLTGDQNATLQAFEGKLKAKANVIDYRSYITLLVNSWLIDDALIWIDSAQKAFPEGDDWKALRATLVNPDN